MNLRSRPNLYLHAGTHKTGTTSIQAFAAKNRPALFKKGLLYPKAAPLIYRLKGIHAHHWFAHALAGKSPLPITVNSVKSYTEKWFNQALKHNADVFISIEALYRHRLGDGSYSDNRKNYLKKVEEILNKFNVIVILVFRRPDDYVRSLYQGQIMDSTKSLQEFKYYYNGNPKRVRYYQNAAIFKEIFKDVRCLIYEDLATSGQFFNDFFNVIGMDISDLDTVGVLRKSFSVPETLLKNYANQYLSNRRENKRFLRWMKSPGVTEQIQKVYGNKEYDLWPSHSARKEFIISREKDLKKLSKTFFSERTQLFPPLKEGDTAPVVPELPEELKKMVLGYFGRNSE